MLSRHLGKAPEGVQEELEVGGHWCGRCAGGPHQCRARHVRSNRLQPPHSSNCALGQNTEPCVREGQRDIPPKTVSPPRYRSAIESAFSHVTVLLRLLETDPKLRHLYYLRDFLVYVMFRSEAHSALFCFSSPAFLCHRSGRKDVAGQGLLPTASCGSPV